MNSNSKETQERSKKIVLLVANRQKLKAANTEALWSALAFFRKKYPNRTWSYIEVCTHANLKSSNALKESWNSNIKSAIDAHNHALSGTASAPSIAKKSNQLLRESIRELRLTIQNMELGLSRAASQIAVWEAEANAFELESRELRRINLLLTERLQLLENTTKN